MIERLFEVDPEASEKDLRILLERFEELKSKAAAAQARATALWARKRTAAERAAGIPARRRGKGLASEIAGPPRCPGLREHPPRDGESAGS